MTIVSQQHQPTPYPMQPDRMHLSQGLPPDLLDMAVDGKSDRPIHHCECSRRDVQPERTINSECSRAGSTESLEAKDSPPAYSSASSQSPTATRIILLTPTTIPYKYESLVARYAFPSSVPRPDFDKMKERRRRLQATAATGGAVAGLVLGGPLGSLIMGYLAHSITKGAARRREGILRQKYAQRVLEEREYLFDPSQPSKSLRLQEHAVFA